MSHKKSKTNSKMKKLTISFVLFITILSSCTKTTGDIKPNEDIKGTWILKGSNGIGPASKLVFSEIDNTNILSFDITGSLGANGLKIVKVPYKMDNNNKLSLIQYINSKNDDYRNITSFEWVVPGREFTVKFHEILLSISSDTKVNYVKLE